MSGLTNGKRVRRGAALAAVASLALGACATRGDIDSLMVEHQRVLERQDDLQAQLDAAQQSLARLEQPDTLVLPPSPFSQLTTPSGKAMERFNGKPIGDDVRFAKVIVAHEAEPREEGVADLFFFPSGLTQHAVVQLIAIDPKRKAVVARGADEGEGESFILAEPIDPEHQFIMYFIPEALRVEQESASQPQEN